VNAHSKKKFTERNGVLGTFQNPLDQQMFGKETTSAKTSHRGGEKSSSTEEKKWQPALKIVTLLSLFGGVERQPLGLWGLSRGLWNRTGGGGMMIS
jgi:hypothetical protein